MATPLQSNYKTSNKLSINREKYIKCAHFIKPVFNLYLLFHIMLSDLRLSYYKKKLLQNNLISKARLHKSIKANELNVLSEASITD